MGSVPEAVVNTCPVGLPVRGLASGRQHRHAVSGYAVNNTACGHALLPQDWLREALHAQAKVREGRVTL